VSGQVSLCCLMMVARRATPPVGIPQPHGRVYPHVSLVWTMVSSSSSEERAVAIGAGVDVGTGVGDGVGVKRGLIKTVGACSGEAGVARSATAVRVASADGLGSGVGVQPMRHSVTIMANDVHSRAFVP